jgi:transposase
MKKQSKHPVWATKHKRKGTELRLINGRYYLYEVTSKWNPEKKRPQKITGKLLGRITKEEGFVESEKAKLRKQQLAVSKLTVKEFGISSFIHSHLNEYIELLKKHFPQHWKQILVLAYTRMAHHSPIKNVEFHYHHSYLSVLYEGLKLSPKQLSSFYREFGTQRENIVSFFREFKSDNDNILFDGTDLLSRSKKMDITKLTKTKKGNFDTASNIMFAFSTRLKLPLYYRVLPGNIKDIKAFKLSLDELNVKDSIVVADKGFYSKSNVDELQKENVDFIIPLRRNNSLINYNDINTSDKSSFTSFFKFQERIIWYYTYKTKEGLTVNVYLDEELKTEEIKDYLNRIETHPEKYNMNTFFEKQNKFGTITILHNTGKKPEDVYINYKSRNQIEEMIDVMKNILEADKSYMQNEQALETWMFINHITLHWYYKIYQLLADYNLTKKYAPMDFLMFLKEVRKVKVNSKWYIAEMTNKTEKLLKSLNIDIT